MTDSDSPTPGGDRSALVAAIALMVAVIVVVVFWSLGQPRRNAEAAAAAAAAAEQANADAIAAAVSPTLATLVAAPDDASVIPVSAGWLPPGADVPVITNDGKTGFGTVTWWLGSGGGADQIWLQYVTPTFKGGLDAAMGLNMAPRSAIQESTFAVNGHPAKQVAVLGPVGSECRIGWQQRPDLGVIVYQILGTERADHGCADVRRMAESVTEKPWSTTPTVRVGLIPTGYTEPTSAFRMQSWCRPGSKVVGSDTCVMLMAEGATGSKPSTTVVTVHGQAAGIDRTDQTISISVFGSFTLMLPGPKFDASLAGLSDADLVRMAESVIVP